MSADQNPAHSDARSSVPDHRPEYGDVPGWAVPTADPREVVSDEPLGTCVVHGDYWTDDCLRCGW